MNKGRSKWFLAILAGVLVIVVCAFGYFLYMKPRLELSAALPQLFSQLEERFQRDPLRMVATLYDQDGMYTADVRLRMNREITGPVTYEMTAQTDLSAHRFFAGGTISSSERAVNASLYLDSSFAAVSSEELVKGNYYGITYDTFDSDIRNLPLLSPFVSEEVLAQWTDTVQRIEEAMAWEYPKGALPELSLSGRDLATLLQGLAALPCTREKVSAPINGENLSCLKLDYSFDGKPLQGIVTETAEQTGREDTAVLVSFYLYDKSVVRMLIQYQQGKESCSYSMTFGKDPAHDPLTFQGNENKAGIRRSYSLYMDTKQQEGRTEQTIRYETGQSAPVLYTYEWESATGTMYLMTDGIPEPVKLRLFAGDTGLQVETSDFGHLLQVLTRKPNFLNYFDGAACSMTIRKGSQIQTPTYRNIDSWSFDDLLILLGGIGSVAGLNFT